MDFHGYGAILTVDAARLQVTRDLLSRGRGGEHDCTVDLADIIGIDTIEPTALVPGELRLRIRGGPDITVSFLTDQTEAMRAACAAIGGSADQAGPEPVEPEPAEPEPAQFVALDVETANGSPGSIIEFGVAVVRAGTITETRRWRCQPPAGLERFDPENVAVHGITPEDLADEPPFGRQWDLVRAFVGNAPVIAHNSHFDLTQIRAACLAAEVPLPTWDFGCTLLWAQRAAPGLANYQLPTVAAAAGHQLTEHHDAQADAAACADIALWLMGEETDPLAFSRSLGFVPGHLDSSGLSHVRNGDSRSARRPRKDAARWDAVRTPDEVPEANTSADTSSPLYGAQVTLTGDFAPFDKGHLWDLIAAAGGTVGRSVTKKTTVLVVGPWESVTAKQRRAEELQANGQDIEIWPSERLFAILGLVLP